LANAPTAKMNPTRVVVTGSGGKLGKCLARALTTDGEPWPRYLPMDENHPPRRPNIHGSSNLFGEELGRIYSIRHEMSVICLRPHSIVFGDIGQFTEPLGQGRVACWDVVEAFRLTLITGRKYGVYNITGLDWSRVTSARAAEELGYRPRW